MLAGGLLPQTWSLDQIVAQLSKPLQSGFLLPVPWPTGMARFSFLTAVSPDSARSVESQTFSAFNAAQMAAARLAQAAVADVSGLSFVQVTGGQGNQGDIRFAN